jgi:hypothetical protein
MPARRSTSLARRAISTISVRSSDGCRRRASSTSTVTTPRPVAGSRTASVGLSATSRRTTSPVTLSTVNRSGLTRPDTSGSPSPQTDSTTTLDRSPLAGLRVMKTPAARGGHHLLDDHGHRVLRRLAPVRDRAARVEAGPALPDVLLHVFDAAHP